MVNVLLKLREAQKSFSPSERGVAGYILNNPDKAANQSIHDLADASYSSPSTVIRVCKRIGCSGYRELRKELVYEMGALRHASKARLSPKGKGMSTEAVAQQVTQQNILSLNDSLHLLDWDAIAACITLLHGCHHILLFGIGSSLCVARDAYLKFTRINRACLISDDWHVQLLHARNATRKDVAIVISYSGETEEVIACMETLKKSAVPIIAVTRCASSRASRLATYNLYVPSAEPLLRSAAMTSRISQLNIIDILFTLFVNYEPDAYVQQITKTHMSKQEQVNDLYD